MPLHRSESPHTVSLVHWRWELNILDPSQQYRREGGGCGKPVQITGARLCCTIFFLSSIICRLYKLTSTKSPSFYMTTTFSKSHSHFMAHLRPSRDSTYYVSRLILGTSTTMNAETHWSTRTRLYAFSRSVTSA